MSAFVTILAMLEPGYAAEPQAVEGCDTIRFEALPRVVLHTSGMEEDVAEGVSTAMTDVQRQLAALGTALAELATEDRTALTFEAWGEPTEPVIHVGFTDDPEAKSHAVAWNVDAETCIYREAHIQFATSPEAGWELGEPGPADYFRVGSTAPSGAHYFRATYLVSLLEAFGLKPTTERAWLNRDEGDRLVLMPDDIAGLASLYPPGPASPIAAALINGLVTEEGAALLCGPAAGNGWAPWNAERCAEDVSETACPGDYVRARVGIVNYGTERVNAQLGLWFSTDTTVDDADVASPSQISATTEPQSHGQVRYAFRVPGSLSPDTEYTLIIKATGAVENEIPLRTKIRTGSSCEE